MELLNEFWDILVEQSQNFSNFQRMALFHKLNGGNDEGKILDFFQYLQNHDIIRVGLDFNSCELPFMKFTKYGKTLIENDVRKTVIFKAFLELYNSD